MDDKKFEKDIEKSLLNNTNEASNNKERMWNNIERKLNKDQEVYRTDGITENNSNKLRTSKHKKKCNSKRWFIGTVAATLLLAVFLMNTSTGQAVVDNITEYFVPEKNVVDNIEGTSEEKEVTLQESKAGYIIYIDEERYKLVEEENLDKIVPKEPLGEIYPEVSMTISQVEETEPEQLAKEIKHELEDSYGTVNEITEVDQPFKALMVYALDGNEWDSQVTRVYIISNQKKGSFVIQEKFFLEAEEGHGTRFNNMLKEFEVVEISE